MTRNHASLPADLLPRAAGDDDMSGIGVRDGQGQVGLATRTRDNPK
jgi:hypothetical protein